MFGDGLILFPYVDIPNCLCMYLLKNFLISSQFLAIISRAVMHNSTSLAFLGIVFQSELLMMEAHFFGSQGETVISGKKIAKLS